MDTKKFLFTSESVTEGHPDKICDQISDAVLDALIADKGVDIIICIAFFAPPGITENLIDIIAGKIKKSDNEILYWVQSHVDKHPLRHLFNPLFDYIIQKRYKGWRLVFAEYFKSENHPVNIAASHLDAEQIKLTGFNIKK